MCSAVSIYSHSYNQYQSTSFGFRSECLSCIQTSFQQPPLHLKLALQPSYIWFVINIDQSDCMECVPHGFQRYRIIVLAKRLYWVFYTTHGLSRRCPDLEMWKARARSADTVPGLLCRTMQQSGEDPGARGATKVHHPHVVFLSPQRPSHWYAFPVSRPPTAPHHHNLASSVDTNTLQRYF